MFGRLTLVFFVCVAFVSLAPASDDKKKPIAPPAPKEFAFVLSYGYGEQDRHPSDPKVFENLLVNMKKSGFNCIHCVYRDWRADLCRKHGVKMMVDVLAWKESAQTDIRRPEQRKTVKKICEKCRGDDAIWGYNLWNETLSFFGHPDGKDIDEYIAMIREWDPTHPLFVGTRTVVAANMLKQNPGIHGYYDYAWHRGFMWHYADLLWYFHHVPKQDGYIGRWEEGSDYNRNAYSLNTSLCFGTKVTIWFIGGPFDKEGNVDPRHRFYHLVRVGQETMPLYAELGKFGRPTHVFSTVTTRTHDDKERDKTKDRDNKGAPWGLTPFPTDYWFKVRGGEVLAGFFKYPSGDDAVFIANHNAYAAQHVAFSVGATNTAVEIFDRKNKQWQRLDARDGKYTFELKPAGGELLRVRGRVEAK